MTKSLFGEGRGELFSAQLIINRWGGRRQRAGGAILLLINHSLCSVLCRGMRRHGTWLLSIGGVGWWVVGGGGEVGWFVG